MNCLVNKRITSLIIVIVLFCTTLFGCENPQTVVKVKYDFCPATPYECHNENFGITKSYPLRLSLPKKHGIMAITIVASNAGGFTKNMGDALFGMPDSYGDWATSVVNGEATSALIDAITSGIGIIATSVSPDETAYDADAISGVIRALSGYQPASYYCSFKNASGKELFKEQILIGSTTFVLSQEVQYIDIVSAFNVGEVQYIDGAIGIGKITYDNAYEISEYAPEFSNTAAGTSPGDNIPVDEIPTADIHNRFLKLLHNNETEIEALEDTREDGTMVFSSDWALEVFNRTGVSPEYYVKKMTGDYTLSETTLQLVQQNETPSYSEYLAWDPHYIWVTSMNFPTQNAAYLISISWSSAGEYTLRFSDYEGLSFDYPAILGEINTHMYLELDDDLYNEHGRIYFRK